MKSKVVYLSILTGTPTKLLVIDSGTPTKLSVYGVTRRGMSVSTKNISHLDLRQNGPEVLKVRPNIRFSRVINLYSVG